MTLNIKVKTGNFDTLTEISPHLSESQRETHHNSDTEAETEGIITTARSPRNTVNQNKARPATSNRNAIVGKTGKVQPIGGEKTKVFDKVL